MEEVQSNLVKTRSNLIMPCLACWAHDELNLNMSEWQLRREDRHRNRTACMLNNINILQYKNVCDSMYDTWVLDKALDAAACIALSGQRRLSILWLSKSGKPCANAARAHQDASESHSTVRTETKLKPVGKPSQTALENHQVDLGLAYVLWMVSSTFGSNQRCLVCHAKSAIVGFFLSAPICCCVSSVICLTRTKLTNGWI